MEERPVILDPHGRPITAADRQMAKACPRCRGTKRVASGGFGLPHPVCPTCGYEWHGEPYVPEEAR